MASLTVRNIPESAMKRLRRAAAEEQRSVNAQAVHWLEQGAGQWMSGKERVKLLRAMGAFRRVIFRRHGLGSDSAEIIRRMREQRATDRP